MAKVTVLEIENLLNDYGWDFYRVNDTTVGTWFDAESRVFDILIHTFDDWIQIEAPNLISPIVSDGASNSFDGLLKINGEMVACKFCVEDDQSLSLVTDIFPENFTNQNWSEPLELLMAYLEKYMPQIQDVYGTN